MVQKQHKKALETGKNTTIIHRVSFLNKTFDKGENEQKQQQSALLINTIITSQRS